MERLTTTVSVAFVGVAAVVLTSIPAGAQGTGVSALASRDRLQVRAKGKRGGTVWEPVAERADRDEQLGLL